MKTILFSCASIALALVLLGCLGGSADSGANQTTTSPILGVSTMASDVVVNGSKVAVDYVGSFENGTLFDTSIAAEAQKAGLAVPANLQPLEFTVGSGAVIPGFNDALIGMKVGQEKTVTILPLQGYGMPSSENVVAVNASQLDQSGGVPKVGMQVSNAYGARGLISAVGNGTVTIDFNPPLAGKTLVFKVILRKIG